MCRPACLGLNRWGVHAGAATATTIRSRDVDTYLRVLRPVLVGRCEDCDKPLCGVHGNDPANGPFICPRCAGERRATIDAGRRSLTLGDAQQARARRHAPAAAAASRLEEALAAAAVEQDTRTSAATRQFLEACDLTPSDVIVGSRTEPRRNFLGMKVGVTKSYVKKRGFLIAAFDSQEGGDRREVFVLAGSGAVVYQANGNGAWSAGDGPLPDTARAVEVEPMFGRTFVRRDEPLLGKLPFHLDRARQLCAGRIGSFEVSGSGFREDLERTTAWYIEQLAWVLERGPSPRSK